jgi:hypothetical protein
MELIVLLSEDVLVVLDLFEVSFGRLDKCGLAVDNVLEAVDKLPHFSGCDPACALGGRVGFTISRSFPYDLGWVDRYSRLEILN